MVLITTTAILACAVALVVLLASAGTEESDEEGDPWRRERPDVQQVAGPPERTSGQRVDIERNAVQPGRCPACETVNDPTYIYCRSCVRRFSG